MDCSESKKLTRKGNIRKVARIMAGLRDRNRAAGELEGK
jgi:hypothetical protein